MANKSLIADSPDLSLEQKVMALLLCIAQEKKVELERRLGGVLPSVVQLNLLHALDYGPQEGLTVNQLKASLADDSPNVSRALNKLVEQGHVEKSRSEDDQRVVRIRITRAGRKAHREADSRIEGLSLGLGKRDLKQLFELLSKL